MRKILTLIICFSVIFLQAQDRYLDKQFGVTVENDVTFATNVSILTGAPADQDLKMDIYMPSGDTETERPLILVAHTGSFLPPLFNGGITGARSDSSTVNICRRLAERGYVVAAYTYRQGWLPTSEEENVRRGTLLQAAYRGIQDTRSCVRYFRKNAAVDGNEYGIDPDKIGIVGVGTGGYLSFGAGSVYDWSEVNLAKFIDTNTASPYIDSLALGNLYGDTDAALCKANTPGYSSDISFAFNLGGACGDASWIDGDDNEPAFAGVHCVNDIFAPYGDGPVIVPTTMEFVVNVAGTRSAIDIANQKGNNDVLDFTPYSISLTEEIEAQASFDVTNYAMINFDPMGTDNFYGFNLPFPQGGPWDWWDKPTLDAVVAGTNAALGTTFDADELHMSGLQTNMNMSQQQGLTYLDTIMDLMLPRACLALNLGCALDVSIENIDAEQVGLELFPNPATDQVTIQVNGDVAIEKIYIYDLAGRLVQAHVAINDTEMTINRNNLADGYYIARVTTDQGEVAQKFILN